MMNLFDDSQPVGIDNDFLAKLSHLIYNNRICKSVFQGVVYSRTIDEALSMAKTKIHVAGDVCIDLIGVPIPRHVSEAGRETPNWRLTGEICTHYVRGGALLLADMVHAAVPDTKVSGPQLITPESLCCGQKCGPLKESLLPRLTKEEIVHSVVSVEEFKSDPKADKKKTTLRVARTEGFSGPAHGDPTLKVEPPGSEEADFIVLDDTGNSFRRTPAHWPAALVNPKPENPPLIVHKLHRPLPVSFPVPPADNADEASQAPGTSLLWNKLVAGFSEQRIVVLSVEDLRDNDAPISRGLSWERTAMELIWQLLNVPKWGVMKDTPHLIVRLGLDGAVYWRHDESDKDNPYRAWLIYNPTGIEGAWETSFEGNMVGYGSAFTAGLVKELVERNNHNLLGFEQGESKNPEPPAAVIEGIRTGLRASRRLLQVGFGDTSADLKYPLDKLFEQKEKKPLFACQKIPIIPEAAVPDRGYWRLIDSIFTGKTRYLNRAVSMMATGAQPPELPPDNEDKIAKNLLDQVPVAIFAGALQAYDRSEIENYRALYSLMFDYVRQTAPPRPLSIAVFGPPGAGKSFGVKMVAKALEGCGARATETLTFNLSQYQKADELAAAFHLVRDVVLKGKIPLVFFDEFDTALEGKPLGWLRYLLSPMQDAEFVDRGTPHPTGQSIFVFAGGACNNYKEFARPFLERNRDKEAAIAFMNFKNAKGPDFLSRLRGALDIPGLDLNAEFNPYGPVEAFPCEAAILFRRANIFAFQLRQKAPGLLDGDNVLQVSDPVICALSHLPKFEHGNRSFEALLDMSHLVGANKLTPSLLPASGNAALHANADHFMQLLAADYPFPPEAREKMAKAIHLAYIQDMKNRIEYDPGKNPSVREWNELPDNLRESNREQADHIAVKLRAAGLWFRKILPEGSALPDVQQRLEKLLEMLAKSEHDRWVAEKRRAGWIAAPSMDPKSRNDYLLLHNCIFPWEQLTEKIKDLDRTTVRMMPKFLKAGGYEIYIP